MAGRCSRDRRGNEKKLTDEEFDRMFSIDGMFGSFKFLGKWLNVDEDPELFRADIEKYFATRHDPF